ncbi:hypothetical protein Airi02_082800 [Actinoallomurus iriomotensis]|uniref:Thioesterase n=2 Tax=Actinoallomurus iriomotensis TaxID=478107 RepID=A0A9W6W5S9_9ACTN|nr:hypothetical protein Airi02_082800 [Actinoallomurus iriomotensis]
MTLHELERLSRELGGASSPLDDLLGIEYLEATTGRVVARMPVEGNTQVYGVLHGGASCALAEAAGSCAAAIHAGPGRTAVGIEINATHHRPAGSGHVTAVATVSHAGRTLVTCDVVITDEQDRRVCTARVTSMLRDRPRDPEPDVADEEPRIAPVVERLASRGAAEIAHPGGTLLAHLERVHALLAEWGARPALRLAGLCHAYYGTDGFATALGDPDHRDELTALIGEEAEGIVHFYAGCDRRFSHPGLADPAGPFRDRFTGAVLQPPLSLRRDFAELTAANELDVMRANPELHARYGAELLDLFTSWRALLSVPAWQAVRATLR